METINMPLPPHLFKPFDALEFRLYGDDNLNNGQLNVQILIYGPSAGTIAVIKSVNFVDSINNVWIEVFKNGGSLFNCGKAAVQDRMNKPAHFFEYWRENPLILREGDKIIVKANNTSGVTQAVFVELFGYTYPQRRQDELDGIMQLEFKKAAGKR
jgi:hypothetical protein